MLDDHKENRESYSREALLKPSLSYISNSCYVLPQEFLERNKDYVFAYVNLSQYLSKSGPDYYTAALAKGYVPVLKEELEPFNPFSNSPYAFLDEIKEISKKNNKGSGSGSLRREQCVEVRDEILMKCERRFVEERRKYYEQEQMDGIKNVLKINTARLEKFDPSSKPSYELPWEESRAVQRYRETSHPLEHLFGSLPHVEATGSERFLRY